MTAPDDILMRATALTKVYGGGDTAVHAVNEIDLTVQRGELVLIKGPSGSGKTTLLSMLGGLMQPTSGRVVVMGKDFTELSTAGQARVRAQSVGFVFQAYNLLSALSVEENILFPARLARRDLTRARERVVELMKHLDLTRRRRALPAQLSGGEKQRVAVARALINDPPLIMADEPTGNLDSQRGFEVAMILHDIARDDHRGVIIVTHDPRIEDVADRVLWLEDGHLRDRKREPHEWVTDPVCGMRVDRWTATALAQHGSREYVFCTTRCRDRFTAEPARYLESLQTAEPSATQRSLSPRQDGL